MEEDLKMIVGHFVKVKADERRKDWWVCGWKSTGKVMSGKKVARAITSFVNGRCLRP